MKVKKYKNPLKNKNFYLFYKNLEKMLNFNNLKEKFFSKIKKVEF